MGPEKRKKEKDMPAPRHDGGEGLLLTCGRRQGHLGEAKVDMTLSHWRRGGKEGKRERCSSQEAQRYKKRLGNQNG